MKKYIVKLVYIFFIYSLFSCSKDEDIRLNDFSGLYKIQFISSNIPIDLNNDGIKTNNYLQEIKSNYISYSGEIINFGYNNELMSNYAMAKPANFLNINFPIQQIDSVFQGNNNFEITNMRYNKMNTGFVYKIINNTIEIESDPFNEFEFYNINNFSINRLTKDTFGIKFDFKVYDFSENAWIETQLEAHYIKVSEE